MRSVFGTVRISRTEDAALVIVILFRSPAIMVRSTCLRVNISFGFLVSSCCGRTRVCFLINAACFQHNRSHEYFSGSFTADSRRFLTRVRERGFLYHAGGGGGGCGEKFFTCNNMGYRFFELVADFHPVFWFSLSATFLRKGPFTNIF